MPPHVENCSELACDDPALIAPCPPPRACTSNSELLDRGEENYIFHRGLQCAVLRLPPKHCQEAFKLKACELPSGALRASGRLSEAHKAKLTDLYRGLRERFEKSPAAARIPLTLLEGGDLRSALGEKMTGGVCLVGIPLTFLEGEDLRSALGEKMLAAFVWLFVRLVVWLFVCLFVCLDLTS